MLNSERKNKIELSFEFYPAKTKESADKLQGVYTTLARYNPSFFSVTFGAGGSTRDKTAEAVLDIQQKGINAAPHLSCVASTEENVREILGFYKTNGISKIVALRGDLPSGTLLPGVFRYANELVEFIRNETGNYYEIHVAAYPEVHPQASNVEKDFQNFKRKVEAGADFAITQYFYNLEAYLSFSDKCEKNNLNIPLIPGIMPITNYSQLSRFSEMCGAEIPRWMRKNLEGFGDNREAIKSFGEDVVSRLCEQLIANGAPGFHFYTMNQAKPSLAILKNIGLGKI